MKRNKNRKEEIFAVAARLFRKKGYAASSMRDIAELVGIEPSSLYSHIKSKEELLVSICIQCAQEFDTGMQKVVNTSKSTNADKILELIDLHIDIAFNKPSSVTVFNDEWKHLPEAELKKFLKLRNDYEHTFKQLLKEGVEKGEFLDIAPSTSFQIIINSLKWIHYYAKRITKSQLEEIRKEIKQFISKGLFLKSN